MRDYWLGKLFFDLQNPEAAKEYRSGREEVLKRYPLKEDVRQAVMSDDVTFLALRVNAYLLLLSVGRHARWRIHPAAESGRSTDGDTEWLNLSEYLQPATGRSSYATGIEYRKFPRDGSPPHFGNWADV